MHGQRNREALSLSRGAHNHAQHVVAEPVDGKLFGRHERHGASELKGLLFFYLLKCLGRVAVPAAPEVHARELNAPVELDNRLVELVRAHDVSNPLSARPEAWRGRIEDEAHDDRQHDEAEVLALGDFREHGVSAALEMAIGVVTVVRVESLAVEVEVLHANLEGMLCRLNRVGDALLVERHGRVDAGREHMHLVGPRLDLNGLPVAHAEQLADLVLSVHLHVKVGVSHVENSERVVHDLA